MREYKKFFNRFAPYDKTGICKYLERKAADGWLLVDMSSIMWEYKRIEPRNLKFSVVYYSKVSDYDPQLTEGQRSFVEFCEHSGWNFAASFEQTFVFYTDSEDTVPIETDAVAEVENIHRVMKRKLLLPCLLLIISQGLRLFTSAYDFFNNTIDELLSEHILINIPLVFLFLVLASEAVEYIVWYIRAKRLASLGGGFLSTKNFISIKAIAVWLIMLTCFFMYSVSSSDSSVLTVLLCGLLVVAIILVTVRGIIALLKKLNVSRTVNRAVSVMLTLAVSVAGLYASVNVVMKYPRDNVQDYNNVQYKTEEEFRETAPLEIADFIKETEGTKAWIEQQTAVFAEKFNATQYAESLTSGEEYCLEYTVFEIRLPFIRRACINNLIEKYGALGNYLDVRLNRVSHREISAQVWSADEAYVLCVDGEAVNRYLLCYGNKIVEFIPSWTLTAEQVAVVAETFGK